MTAALAESRMRAYVATTGVIFALLAVAHVWRVAAEGRHVADPFFIAITALAAAISAWAWWVLRRPSGP